MNDHLRALHARAVQEGRRFYLDPATGYRVFTELAHLERGVCCGSACRHCPFGHVRVRQTTPRGHGPWWQLAGPPEVERLVLVAWSGGKDSFLALRRTTGPVALLTTYDPATNRVPIQEIPIDTIRAQARALRLDLLAVPVLGDYAFALRGGVEVARRRAPVEAVVFGDLHLADLRAWRERVLSDVPLRFPLWGAPYAELLDELERSGARVTITASSTDAARVGERFDRALVARLPASVDAFGENGEFHTVVAL